MDAFFQLSKHTGVPTCFFSLYSSKTSTQDYFKRATRLVLLISGNGFKLQAKFDAIASGVLPKMAISKRRDAYGF